ncbi:hypothetical protein ACFLY9_01695 [Patescibacteria group bacterium]
MADEIESKVDVSANIQATIERNIQAFKEEFIDSAKRELHQEGELQLGAMTFMMLSRLSAFREDLDGPLSNLYFTAGYGDGLKDVDDHIDYLRDMENKLKDVFGSCRVNSTEIDALLTFMFGKFEHIYEAGKTGGKRFKEKNSTS